MTKKPYKFFKTSNGIPVHLYKVPSVMAINAVLYVRVGSSYETVKNNGISHLIEHLSFTGTKSYPSTLELTKALQKSGVSRSAWTYRTDTRFEVNFPYDHLEDGISLLYEITQKPTMSEGEIEEEKKIIFSEYQDLWTNPDRKFSETVWQRNFEEKDHPYSFRPMGTPDSLKNIGKTEVTSWFKKYFTPSNMFLCVSGNIEAGEVEKILEKTFGKGKKKKRPKKPKFDVKTHTSFSIFHQQEDRDQISFYITFPAKGYKEMSKKERLYLNLFTFLLGGSFSSRLHLRLREKEKIAYQLSANHDYQFPWWGSYGISGSVPKAKLIKAMRFIKEELDKVVDKGFSKEEVKIAKNYSSSSTLKQFDSPLSICYFLASQEARDEEIWFPEDYVNEIKKLSRKKVNKLAKDLTNYKRMNLSFLGGLTEKELEKIRKIFRA